ncbi:helix-turn-helix transcriptional regulator [Allosphingosinicella flava]|uniref:Helix-turn-helix transcriptional regulator n=1 Tax=Allosphingosinicella flava TaxID=2771430 RepID=A0A7T2GKK2_9SPHN|nr:helix-turn-helix transcriptional regulator [Sphingosinicella flava]QPQ55576.1 helix-turn-helix transcriptional regulator [Sphingosinicella flava]
MSIVRETRLALGLSQADLAAKLGVHQTTVSRFETGDLPVDERTQLALEALIARNKPVAKLNKSSRPFPSPSTGKTEAAAA